MLQFEIVPIRVSVSPSLQAWNFVKPEKRCTRTCVCVSSRTCVYMTKVFSLPPLQSPSSVFLSLGQSPKIRDSFHLVFSLAHRHSDILREGWKNILDYLLTLFKAKLLPDCLVEVRGGSVAMWALIAYVIARPKLPCGNVSATNLIEHASQYCTNW